MVTAAPPELLDHHRVRGGQPGHPGPLRIELRVHQAAALQAAVAVQVVEPDADSLPTRYILDHRVGSVQPDRGRAPRRAASAAQNVRSGAVEAVRPQVGPPRVTAAMCSLQRGDPVIQRDAASQALCYRDRAG